MIVLAIGILFFGSVTALAQQTGSTAKPEGGTPSTSSSPSASKPRTPSRVRISQMTSEKMIVKKVQPLYPREASRGGIQGSVVMNGVIATDGTVKELSLVSGHPLLAKSALEAVQQWHYKPYVINGVAVEAETKITVNYELRP